MGGSVFSRYFDVFTAKPGGAGADQFGRFPVPGEQTLDLPQGRVRIYYDVAQGYPGSDHTFRAPRDFRVTIADAETGEAVPIRLKLPLGGSSVERNDFARTYIGRVEIAKAGRYRVTASLDAPQPDEPHVSLGK